MNRATEHKVYKLAKEKFMMHLEQCIELNIDTSMGMYFSIEEAIFDLDLDFDYKDFPNFMALKPKNKDTFSLWWKNKNTSKVRPRKFDKIIYNTRAFTVSEIYDAIISKSYDWSDNLEMYKPREFESEFDIETETYLFSGSIMTYPNYSDVMIYFDNETNETDFTETEIEVLEGYLETYYENEITNFLNQ